ncbi:MAG TPA: transglutaminase family protein [Chlamydiales bacterium]|nr:transglutaminase family protein [Chlamydiales bacterium]
MKQFFLPFFLLINFLHASSFQALYKSIPPNATSKYFAFYNLYPETFEGKQALEKGWKNLKIHLEKQSLTNIPSIDIHKIIDIISYGSTNNHKILSEQEIEFIKQISMQLPHKSLKGHKLYSEEEILALPENELDLARAIFVSKKASKQEIASYEATLDLMAIHILAKLPPNPSIPTIIETMNQFLFFDLRFRFPPQSTYAKDIDTYTFLSSVMDSRRGVCLGVSTLYLCLAQRLNIPLEIITPPGHIFIRYNNNNNIINIETTARGIHLPSEEYLSIETKALEKRTLKEVVGLIYMNEASIYWMKKKYNTAKELYEKAQPYLKNDYLLKMFLGYQYLFTNQKEKGKALLASIKDFIPPHHMSKDSIIEDYLSEKTGKEGIEAVYLSVDDNRESIIEKQKALKKIVKKHPYFRMGLFQLAITYLQLSQEKEAYSLLKKLHKMDSDNVIVNYYLAILSYKRYNFPAAKQYSELCAKILESHKHMPKAFISLVKEINRKIPLNLS